MASLPASSQPQPCWYQDRKANTGRRDNCQGPTFGYDSITEAHALAPGMSVQKAELIAPRACPPTGAEKTVNIYTDSKYGFTTLHVHGAIYIYV
jgi:hypothetical protein